jgi:FkbM family methyltransferase
MELPWERAWAFPNGNYWELNVVTRFDRILGDLESPVVYDIGANCGYFTLLAARRSRFVYAFEPTLDTWTVLVRNIERNNLGHVHAFRFALTDQPGEVDLYKYSSSGNNSLLIRRVGVGAGITRIGTERVRGIPLDEVIVEKKLEPPSLIKIDVEGSEFLVLEGALKTLRTHAPVVIMEHNEARARAAGYSLGDVVSRLEEFGYSLGALGANVFDHRLNTVDLLRREGGGTIVATPLNA